MILKMHYQSRSDTDMLATIDEAVYRELLTTKTGPELAKAVSAAITVVDNDPRMSEVDDTDVFFSYNDVAGFITPAELLEELNEAIAGA